MIKYVVFSSLFLWRFKIISKEKNKTTFKEKIRDIRNQMGDNLPRTRDDFLLSISVFFGTILDSPCLPLYFLRLDEVPFLWALRLSYIYLSHRNGPFLIQYLPMAFWKADCTLELWIIKTLHGPWHVVRAPCMFSE